MCLTSVSVFHWPLNVSSLTSVLCVAVSYLESYITVYAREDDPMCALRVDNCRYIGILRNNLHLFVYSMYTQPNGRNFCCKSFLYVFNPRDMHANVERLRYIKWKGRAHPERTYFNALHESNGICIR